MARRKQAPKDLTGIRQRGGRYQIRLFGGQDPVTGKQVMLTGSAEDEDAAIKLRDKFRRQVAEATAARTSVTLGYLLDEWLAGHQVEETTRTSYRVAIEKFLKPAVGDTSLSRLAQLGAPVRAALRRAAGLPAAVQGPDVHRAPHASGARLRPAVRAASMQSAVRVIGPRVPRGAQWCAQCGATVGMDRGQPVGSGQASTPAAPAARPALN